MRQGPIWDSKYRQAITSPRVCLKVGLFALATAGVPSQRDGHMLPAYLCLATASIQIAARDAETLRIPNALTLPLCVMLPVFLGYASVEEHRYQALARATMGACLLFFAFLLVASQGWIGFGDVKLVGILGLWLGYQSWRAVLVGVGIGWLLATVWAGLAVVRGRRQIVPMAPFLVAGTLLATML